MPTVKLTIRSVKAARYEGDRSNRYFIWDTELRGFGLRVYPSGRKAFVLSYRTHGRKRLMVLGDFGTFTVDQARDRAGKKLRMVRDGKDPMEEDRKAAQGQTFKDLKRKYLEEHAKVHKKTWEADARRLGLTERPSKATCRVPGKWDTRLASSITRGDVSALHAKLGKDHPYEANRLLEVLRKMFNLARVWEFPGFEDATKINPAEGIKRFPERKRKRFVQPHELPLLAKALDAEANIYVRAAIWLYILTGVRRSELLTAKWDQVEWEARRLRLPETKSGDEQHASLSGPALAILQGIPKEEGNPHILPGARKGKSLVNIAKPWGRIRRNGTLALWAEDEKVAGVIKSLRGKLNRDPKYAEVLAEAVRRKIDLAGGLLDVRLHDLRRTVGSWMSAADVDLNKIKDALRHANIATTLTYARLGEDSSRDAFEGHGRRILEAAGEHGPLKVLEGGKGKKYYPN